MKKLLIITDLDASFIDDNYQYTEAIEAINQLNELNFPIVFNSSKTLTECKDLAKELNFNTPLISENGGIIAVPNNSELSSLCQQSNEQEWKQQDDYSTLITGLSLDYILNEAHQAREINGYLFDGFSDWTPQKLSNITGLTHQAASLAKQRNVSEPILWHDSSKNWKNFKFQMESKGIRTLRGGRFIHLMGPADKADGLKITKQLYTKKFPQDEWITVALGDSANDQSMLEIADIPVLIPHKNGPQITLNHPNTILAKSPASKGWNDAILQILSTL